MSLCDPDAELRCGTLDCSEPDHPRRAHEGVPWDALEQSVFGAKAAGAQQIHSVRDIQGLDTVLEGHGVLPPASPGHGKDAVERRRSRELLEQQEAAQLMFEKKREADMAMLEKLRGAGATADTLRYVETAIKRRAEAGIYVDSCCASSELHPLTAEAPRPCAAPHTAEAALSARSNVSATDAARARDAWDQNGRHLRDALDRGDESHRGDTSYRGDSYRGDFREDVSFGDDRTHSQAINMNYAKAGLGCTLERSPNGVHVITSVKRGGTADRGGVKAGMVILAINGSDIKGLGMKDVRQLSVGVVGSTVKVVLKPSINAPSFEERELIRFASAPDAADDGDRTFDSRGKLHSDRSDRSSGSTWLRRFFGGNGNASIRAAELESKPGYANGAPLEERGRSLSQPNGLFPSTAQNADKPQRTADGRKIEYDKNGQPWTFNVASMAWTPITGGVRMVSGEGVGVGGGKAGQYNRTTPPRAPCELDAATYDDRTDTSEYGHGPLTDRSVLSPPGTPMASANKASNLENAQIDFSSHASPSQKTLANAKIDFLNHTPASQNLKMEFPNNKTAVMFSAALPEGGVTGSIDDVVDQILQRRSMRLEGRLSSTAERPFSAPAPRAVPLGAVNRQHVNGVPANKTRSMLISLDLQSSSLPPRNDDSDLNAEFQSQGSYAYSSALTPDEEISPEYLVDERKHLWQHLSALENAVKALDAPPTLTYAQETDQDTGTDVSAFRFRGANRDDVQKACITFSAKGLVQGSGRQSQPYLVLVQNDREIGRTEAVDESENVTWKPAQVVFSDEWMPVSVQCCDKSKSTTGILLGENQVPVHDLLTALKEIHLMYQGNLAGKIIVDAVSLGPRTVQNPIVAYPGASRGLEGAPSPPPKSEESVRWNLRVGMKSASHLPKMDTFGSCDPYAVLRLGSQEFKTKTIKGTYEPVWDEEFEFHIDEARNSMNDSLIIEIYDWDRATKDDFIGEVRLLVSSFSSGSSIKNLELSGPDGKLVYGHDKHKATIMVSVASSKPLDAFNKSTGDADPFSPREDPLSPREGIPMEPLGQQGRSREIPEGWKEYFSKSKQRPYYKNKATGETSWYFPKPTRGNQLVLPETHVGTSKKGGVGSGGRSGEDDPEPGAQV